MARFERVALAAICFTSAAACNAIAGLDGFHEVAGEAGVETDGADSSPGPIVDDSGDAMEDSTVVADASVDSGMDAADTGQGFTKPDAGTSVDYRWARWIMPNAALDAGQPSYFAIPGTDGGVTDRVTGLEWGNVTDGVTSIAGATAACGSPWRLPTRIELVSILDTSRSPEVLVNPQFTTMVLPDRFWTSSVTPAGGSWTVDFGEGFITASLSGQAVICIYVGDSDGGTQ